MSRLSCKRCVMDDTASNLALDANGLCSYCRGWDRLVANGEVDEAKMKVERATLVADLKRLGRGKRYDCVVGLSGGADSSYAAYLAVKEGLRPLAVHVDNGWNSELAVLNIERLVRGLNLDLYTVVIRWEQFRDLQLAFLRAGVVDLELPSDHAIIAGTMRTAAQFGIKDVLSGDNNATEAVLPPGWNHRKTDLTNIRSIHDAYTHTGLDSYPQMSTLEFVFRQRVLKTKWRPFLSLYPYVKQDAIALLSKEFGWRGYVGKHGESIITRFYQGVILPTKFGIDKRRLHLSRLICSGQLTKEQALEELTKPHYDPTTQALDREFVIKKFGITEAEFERLLHEAPKPHEDFKSDERLFEVWRWTRNTAKRLLGRS